MAQVAAKSHVAVEIDELAARIKTSFNMEPYARIVNVSGRLKRDERDFEQLQETIKFINGRNEVRLRWAEVNATIQKNFLAHPQIGSLSEGCRRMSLSGNVMRKPSRWICRMRIFAIWMKNDRQ